MPHLRNIMMQLRKCCIHPYLLEGAEEVIVSDSHATSYQDQFNCLVQSSGKLVSDGWGDAAWVFSNCFLRCWLTSCWRNWSRGIIKCLFFPSSQGRWIKKKKGCLMHEMIWQLMTLWQLLGYLVRLSSGTKLRSWTHWWQCAWRTTSSLDWSILDSTHRTILCLFTMHSCWWCGYQFDGTFSNRRHMKNSWFDLFSIYRLLIRVSSLTVIGILRMTCRLKHDAIVLAKQSLCR